ncbi:glycine receptor subunit alpha-3-like [Lingula anatina]|uniref:Glycine receptor subunit alpha-3-like n=1 Tax=Lingula anatina TaxID=7574 RepID=A0A1S3HU83_LINAN|nr:glycine receptor subunit alpha-3-like [Lingula anatina]|eukprot:XP_013389605.1 glycine receptor subunit alpha-3-like [Lingula anatina]
MDYTINIFLRRKWTDARFRFNSTHYNLTEISIDPHRYGDIWSPDLFFTNEKQARFHAITTPNHMIRINGDGQVFFSSRITLTAQCPMHLDKFPMDTQTCQLVLESFAYTTDIIQFHWSQEEKEEQKQINLSQFNLINTSHHERVKSYKSGDVQRNFTRLIMEFVLERDYKYFIIQTYIPSILIVSLSWVGFWISYDSVPARITLGLLTVLTLTTQSYSILQTLPRVSYVKAIDVWMSTCLIFVFLALLEFVLVNTSHRKITRRSIKGNAQLPRKANSAKEDDENHRIWRYNEIRASTVDKCARAFFPLAFLIFIIIYVSVYTAMSDVKYPHD